MFEIRTNEFLRWTSSISLMLTTRLRWNRAVARRKRTTAWAIIRRVLENGFVVRPRGGLRQEASKIDEEMKNTIVAIVEEHAAFMLLQVKNELQVRLPEFVLFAKLKCVWTTDNGYFLKYSDMSYRLHTNIWTTQCNIWFAQFKSPNVDTLKGIMSHLRFC